MIGSLQDNMNEVNLVTVQRLEGKEKLVEKLQSQVYNQRWLKYEVIEKSVILVLNVLRIVKYVI
jgi:hypothetical protein